jgi:hypothetical protein
MSKLVLIIDADSGRDVGEKRIFCLPITQIKRHLLKKSAIGSMKTPSTGRKVIFIVFLYYGDE